MLIGVTVLAASLRHAASMHNPQFYEKQRMRLSTWDIPRFLQFFDETIDGGLIMPRGMLTSVTELAAQAGSKLDLTDERAAGTAQAFTCSAVLTGPQQAAVQVLARIGGTGRAARNGQDRDGVRGDRRASDLHSRPGGPQDPRGPVAQRDPHPVYLRFPAESGPAGGRRSSPTSATSGSPLPNPAPKQPDLISVGH